MKRLAGAGDSQRQVTRNASPLSDELREAAYSTAARVGDSVTLAPQATGERSTRAPRRGRATGFVTCRASPAAPSPRRWLVGEGVRAGEAHAARASTAACATSGVGNGREDAAGVGVPSAAAAKLPACKRIGPRCYASWRSSSSSMIIAAARRLRRACARSRRRKKPESARRSLISPRRAYGERKRCRPRGSPTCGCGLRGSKRGSPLRRRPDANARPRRLSRAQRAAASGTSVRPPLVPSGAPFIVCWSS